MQEKILILDKCHFVSVRFLILKTTVDRFEKRIINLEFEKVQKRNKKQFRNKNNTDFVL